MATTWKVTSMMAIPQEDGLTNVVSRVMWFASDTDGTYSAQIGGEIDIALETDETYTDYTQLTEEIVLDWCFENGLDKVAIEANLARQIVHQANPPVIPLPLPWTST
jgi:hypothetical protein